MIIDATICTRMLGTRMLAVSDYRCHYMYKRFFFRSLFVDHMHACEGWPDSVYRWTEPPWASWRRCWTLGAWPGVELCSINPAYQGKEYRYVYACGAQRPCNFFNSLTKIDIVKKEAKNWYEPGSVPSEPFFVARPGGTDEDDGKFELTEMYFFDVLSSI